MAPNLQLYSVAAFVFLCYTHYRRYIIGQKDKLIRKLKSKPHDFTFDEAEALLNYLSFSRSDKGKTSGSRVKFTSEDHGAIMLHKPHPRKELLEYQVKQLCEKLEQEGLI